MATNLRKNSEVDFVGTQNDKLLGGKLPFVKEVLCVLFYHIRTEKKTVREGATLAVHQVLAIWNKTRIPQIQPIKAIMKLESYYKMWEGLMRNKTRETETEKSKRANFEFQINALFDIAQKDAVEIMQRQILYKDVSEDERIALREDIDFYFAQRQASRQGCIAGVDKVLATRESRAAMMQQNRARKEEQLKARMEKEAKKRKLICGKLFFTFCSF